MTKYSKNNIHKIFSEKEIKVIKEILKIIRDIFKKATKKDAKIFLIGMRALYYYFGMDAFSPAPVSLDIDINFDILLDWVNYRKLIPQKIKEALESLDYDIDSELGSITIHKEGILIHLTTVIEFSEEIIGEHIAELDLDIADKYFVIYTKLSRFDKLRDVNRLENLFKNCEINIDKILEFAPELEKELIKKRINILLNIK